MGLRFNPPPGWPVPVGFTPPPGWQPDPSWPAPPPQWPLWVSDGEPGPAGPGPAAFDPTLPAGQAGPGGQYPQAGPGGQYPQAGPGGQYPQAGPGGQYPQAGPGGQYPQAGYGTGQPTDPGQGYGSPQGYGAAPGYGAGQGYGYGMPGMQPVKPGTNGMAIASLIFGIIGGVILSLIFGLVALSQIRRQPQGGRGLAIAGLVLSGVWVVIIVIIIAIGVANEPTTNSGNPGTNPGTTSVPATTGQVNIFALKVGECFQNPSASQAARGVTTVPVVACTTAHNAQVFAQFDATNASYPGVAALVKEAQQGCQARVGADLDHSKVTKTMGLRFLYPEPTSWTDGRRLISCLVVDKTKDITSSLLSR